jgi:enoyl-[acyl-carrier protein] reductase/trans-2-enoyl-CoA reductase (NAD+)
MRRAEWEMRDDVQKAVAARMKETTAANIFELTDVAGFKHDFLEAHGFDVDGIDYEADAQLFTTIRV